jgi:hypothetical protein
MKIAANAQETRRDKQEQNSERGQIEHIDQKWKEKKKRKRSLFPFQITYSSTNQYYKSSPKKSTEAWQNRQNNTKEGTKNYFSTKGTKNYGI